MKKYYSFLFALSLTTISFLTMTSCQKENDEVIGIKDESRIDSRANSNAVLYPPSAHPFGKSLAEWGQEFSKDAYALDCEGWNLQLLFSLDNNVVAPFLSLSETSMDINITKEQAIFMPLIFIVNDYPCPDPDFEPAEGQSLEDFLQEGAGPYIDVVETLDVVLDGVALGDIIGDYRFISDLFYFTGNAELADCIDPCITGQSQAGVAAGFFIMFKKMKTGQHTIEVHGEMPVYEFEWDITFNVTVE